MNGRFRPEADMQPGVNEASLRLAYAAQFDV